MRGFDPVLDAEPCRRLVFPSCLSPTTNRVPNTAYDAITTTPGWVDAVVIMTGYNDWYDDFGYFFDTIVGAARAKGARQIVWLTYSEEGQVSRGPRRVPEEQHRPARRRRGAGLRATCKWPTGTRTATAATTGPGSTGSTSPSRGAYGLADYFSRWFAHLEGRPVHAPWVGRRAASTTRAPTPTRSASPPTSAASTASDRPLHS